MAEWRFGRGWSEVELQERLVIMRGLPVNISRDGPHVWRRYYTEAVIGCDEPGSPKPGGVLDRAWQAVKDYQFSDPAIVVAHYDPRGPLLGRTMALEIRVLGLHYLCGARVAFVREHDDGGRSVRAFRYDTLHGHIEEGSEWFRLVQDHATGEVKFRIHASWRPGEFPNWWSRVGFDLFSERYQLAWHRLAYLRLREHAGPGVFTLDPVPHGQELVHTGSEEAHGTGLDLWILNVSSPALKAGALGSPTHDPVHAFKQPEGGIHCEKTRRVERLD